MNFMNKNFKTANGWPLENFKNVFFTSKRNKLKSYTKKTFLDIYKK